MLTTAVVFNFPNLKDFFCDDGMREIKKMCENGKNNNDGVQWELKNSLFEDEPKGWEMRDLVIDLAWNWN